MPLMDHIKNALRSKSPEEKIASQVGGMIRGHSHKFLEFDHPNKRVHVLTQKKPFLAGMLARNREHGHGLWREKTFHWNDRNKVTHVQNWEDGDHWASGQPPIRRLSHVFQSNDRMDHMEEGVDSLLNAGFKETRPGLFKHSDGHIITVQKKEYGTHYQSYKNGKKNQVAAFSKVAGAINHVMGESIVSLRPETRILKPGDVVKHPDLEGNHEIYSIPTTRDGKSVAIVRPVNHKQKSFEEDPTGFHGYHRVSIHQLTKV